MTNQDTITVELPIEARSDGRVSVCGLAHTRWYWRKVAASPDHGLGDLSKSLAPAVVAWIERDEWKPLDLPEVGRTLKATLRDRRVETFKVREIEDGLYWAWVWKADSDGARYIQRTFDAHSPTATDIIAWEYVDEPKFREGDWVRVGADGDVLYWFHGAVGVITANPGNECSDVRFPSGAIQRVSEENLTRTKPQDASWKVGDVVPANTHIGREWVGEFVVTGHRSLFGVPDSRTATTDRKIIWLGDRNV